MELAKQRKWFSLAARDVAGRQCIPVEPKSVEVVANSTRNAMWYMGWVRDDSQVQTGDRTVLYRQRIVLYYCTDSTVQGV